LRSVLLAMMSRAQSWRMSSSPTPFTGYTITVPRAEIVELDVSLDEALRFVVSGGVLVPDSQALSIEESTSNLFKEDSEAGEGLPNGPK